MRRLCLLASLVTACPELELSADLEGPRVFASSLPRPRNVEVATMPAIFVDFSEAIDRPSVRVALVAWEEQGSCTFTPRCPAEGTSCERGRCMRDPLSTAAIGKLKDGPLEESVALDAVLSDSPIGPGSRLSITPRRALGAYTRHSLLVFARDLSGAPLVDADGVVSVWRRDLVTAGEGSGGPEARLVAPAPGTEEVPPNLAQVATQFARPVVLDPAATLFLEAADGTQVALIDPVPCAGWVPGLCLRWTPGGPVLSDMAYRTGGGTLRDRLWQAAVEPAEVSWFRTAAAPDTTAPHIADAVLMASGPCLYARLTAEEPLELSLHNADGSDAAVAGPGVVSLALRSSATTAILLAEDLAGNQSTRTLETAPGIGLVIPLGISEILANPRGREPAQEMIELVDLRDAGAPMLWSGLVLADLSAHDVAAALAQGAQPGDALPDILMRPGERIIVVAAGYDPGEGSDPAPEPGTQLVRVDASLGAGGLKNVGEPVTLYQADTATIVASYDNYIDTGATAHAGRSVVADPHACDLARAWVSHPGGGSSPGAAP